MEPIYLVATAIASRRGSFHRDLAAIGQAEAAIVLDSNESCS